MEMNKEMLKKFCKDRKIKNKTIQTYESAIKQYEEYYDMSIEDLIWEALNEQGQGKPEVQQKLFNRLEEYRDHLYNTNLAPSTAKQKLRLVCTFYRHFRVRVPELYQQQTPDEYETNYYDIPNKKHIRQALTIASGPVQAIILFMASSGTAKEESLNLTVLDFIKATISYHNNVNGDIYEILEGLKTSTNIVPLFYLQRVKTGNYYHTCCSPEATHAIINELLSRPHVCHNDPLFDFTHRNLMEKFQQINDELGWGYVKRYRFFTTHALRKFHASNLGLNTRDIHALQGRSNKAMTKIYMKINPEELREKYKTVLDNVTIREPPKSIENAEFHIHINVMLMGNDYGVQI